uniref:C2H2-type domain-containing protein n=1 Tax=Timema douglasi TaxID=61478 RepID=A0A7R8VAJ9_TIMDO|nr:unnamed protein product [Timema douglasi]
MIEVLESQGGSRMKERKKTNLRGWTLLVKPQPFYGLNVPGSKKVEKVWKSIEQIIPIPKVQKEDPLPKYICNACREQIESIEKFQQLCEQTQILLWKQYILTGDCLDKSIRKKRHETQHSGIEENHQVKLLLNRLEKTGISVNKLSPSLWKHISDCYSGADYCSAVSKGIVTQLVQLPAVKVFRLPIGGKIKRLKSNLCNVIQETTPKSKFTHQDNGQDIIKVTKNTCKTKKRIKPCVDTSFGTAQQSTLENLDHSNAQLDSNHDTLSNPVIEQSLHVRSNACTKSATPSPLDLEDFELECVLPKFVITKDNPILTGSKDSDQEVSNESNHCPERSTSPIQKSIVQCSDSTEHIEMVSTKEESIDIVEDIYEPEFVSVSEDFDQKLTPDFNITAKTEKETEFVDVGEMFDNKSTTKPCDIPLVREESHFIIVDTASQAIKTESIWDGNSFELLEARSNDSNILDKARTDVPPTGLVNGNDAERIIDYTDTNDNIESGPLDNCDKPTFSVSSSLWQKHIGNASLPSSQQMQSPLKSILKTPLNNPISKSVSSTNVASFSNLASQSEALIALPQKPSSLTPITTDIGTTVIIPSDSDNCRNIVSSQSSVETDIYRQEADDLFYNIYSSSSTISNSKSLKRVELENNPILENTMDDDNNDNDNDNGWESYENNFEDENQHNSNIETCGQVDVQIGDSENYEKYILRSENKIICKLCEKSFEQNEEYKSHVKLHLKASHFFCRKCKIDVPIISFLNFHLNSCMKTLPPKDLVVLSSDDEPEPTPEANYKCKVCGEKFGFRINLKYHKETHINNKAKYTFLCPLCGQAFKTKNDFRFHKSQHHNSDTNSHVCNECGQTFKFLIELELHKSEQHKQKLTCPYCPTTFSLSSSLKTHMSEHHIVNTSEVINIGD